MAVDPCEESAARKKEKNEKKVFVYDCLHTNELYTNQACPEREVFVRERASHPCLIQVGFSARASFNITTTITNSHHRIIINNHYDNNNNIDWL